MRVVRTFDFMKPHKPANDVKDKSDARNSREADLGRFRPLSPSQNEDLAADGFIPPHGGYENLLSFQKARIVYDGTVRFCERFLAKRDRTYDQMVQAARSGKQQDFLKEGGLRERMTRARLAERARHIHKPPRP